VQACPWEPRCEAPAGPSTRASDLNSRASTTTLLGAAQVGADHPGASAQVVEPEALARGSSAYLPLLRRVLKLAFFVVQRAVRGAPPPRIELDPVAPNLWRIELAESGPPLVVRCLASWWRIAQAPELAAVPPPVLAAALAALLGRRAGLNGTQKAPPPTMAPSRQRFWGRPESCRNCSDSRKGGAREAKRPASGQQRIGSVAK
jgi:hypothetical protein